MADLGDAYSEFTGDSEYTMPTGSEGLSSYGQRFYGQPRVAQAPINTDLQTQLFGLKMEQQKSSAVRQMRDTALASMNLREQNRVEEQAGYVAASLGDLDPHSDDFENGVTQLYSQFPYAFRDPGINQAINYKRDLRKQFDAVNENMRREDSLIARSDKRAQEERDRQEKAQGFKEYDTFRRTINPLYLEDFRKSEDEAKKQAQSEGREFGLDDRRSVMDSFAERAAKEKLNQDAINVGLNTEDYLTESGATDTTKLRKDLFDAGRRKERVAEAAKTVQLFGTKHQKMRDLGEEVPEDEKQLYDDAVRVLKENQSKPKASSTTAPISPFADISTSAKSITERQATGVDVSKDLVSLQDKLKKTPLTLPTGSDEQSVAARTQFAELVTSLPVTKDNPITINIDGKAVVIDETKSKAWKQYLEGKRAGQPKPEATGAAAPATAPTNLRAISTGKTEVPIVTAEESDPKDVVVGNLNLDKTMMKYRVAVRQEAEAAYEAAIADAQKKGDIRKLRELERDVTVAHPLSTGKGAFVDEYVDKNTREITPDRLLLAAAGPLIKARAEKDKRLSQESDSTKRKQLHKEWEELDNHIAAINKVLDDAIHPIKAAATTAVKVAITPRKALDKLRGKDKEDYNKAVTKLRELQTL